MTTTFNISASEYGRARRGGGKAFAIRLRNQFGVIVRETYRPERDAPLYFWRRGWEKPLGYFLADARNWARNRVASHLGRPTAEQRRWNAWEKRKIEILSTEIGAAFDRKIEQIRCNSKDHLYVDHIIKMIGTHIPDEVLKQTFRNIDTSRLADAISQRNISYGNVKVLRGFVGSVFKDASREFSALEYKLESIQKRCSRNLDRRKSPPHPRILSISEGDYRRFFGLLEKDVNWRQSLAIRLYFATGASFQRVLAARWSDIIEDTWYPFVPSQRKLWFESRQRLGADALHVLKQIKQRHVMENIDSPYLFPSLASTAAPIATVQRYWFRYCSILGWNGLPMSHVVLRHRPRSNPSYSLFFYRTYLQSGRRASIEAVSKVGKRRLDNSINAMTYSADHLYSENLIA